MLKFLPFTTVLCLTLAACSPTSESKQPAASEPAAASQPSPTAQSKQGTPEQIYARQAVQLFFNMCMMNMADDARIAAMAAKSKLTELSTQEMQAFNFEPDMKKAWGVHGKEGGRFFLAAGKNHCTVKVKTADAAEIEVGAAEITKQAAEAMGIQYEKVKDAAIASSQTQHQTAYRLFQANLAAELLLTVQTDSNPDAAAQASLNFHLIPQP